jgi:hypothetical protein
MKTRKASFMIVMTLMATRVVALPYSPDEFVCQLQNGETIVWQLEEQPKLGLQDGYFIISSTGATLYCAAEDVKDFSLSSNETAIDAVKKADSSKPVVNSTAGRLVISGCQPKESATIYAVDGKQVKATRVNGDGTLTLNLNELPSGIYIVKLQNVNFKFFKP